MVTRILTWLLLLAGPITCQASQPRDFLRDLTRMQGQIWTSPFKASKKTWTYQALPVLAGTFTLIATDRRILRSLPSSQTQKDLSLGISHLGGLYTLAAGATLPLLIGKLNHNEKLSRSGMAGAQALASSVLLTYALKFSLGRERPDSPGASRFFHGGESFPSGHSLATFALATAFARSKGTPRWLSVSLYIAATSVALSRITALRHHPSDVLFGSALGIWLGNHAARNFAR